VTSGSAASSASACSKGWTPEQIAGWLRRGEERGLRAVSAETIYAFVHRAGQKAEKLWKAAAARARQARPAAGSTAARHHRRAALHPRAARGGGRAARGRALGGRPLICRRTRPVLVLKERKTRFVLAARLAGKSAAETVAVMMAVFRRLDPRLRGSVTFDNDTAFARHGLLASACSMATWFCDAYAPGRRARSRTPTEGCAATCRATSTSTRSATPSCRRSC
jgi:IS30 family transposase